MKDSMKGAVAIWFVLFVIIAGLFLFFSMQNNGLSVVPVAATISNDAATTTDIKRADITVVGENGTKSWKTLTDTQAHISFKYPPTWPAPVKSVLGTRYLFAFKNGLTLEVGQFYNDGATKILTVSDFVSAFSSDENKVNPANLNVVIKSFGIGSKTATKVSYTQISDLHDQTKVFIPNRSATDIVVVTNADNFISPVVLDAFVGTIVSK